jgi:hypothetical protein
MVEPKGGILPKKEIYFHGNCKPVIPIKRKRINK